MTALEVVQTQALEPMRQQVEAVKALIAYGCTDAELDLFSKVCERTGLDPFAKQIYAIKRGGKMTVQTSIDGFRVVADRAAARQGVMRGEEDTLWCGPDGKWMTEWLSSDPPAAARYTVTKVNASGAVARFKGTARWDAYRQDTGLWKSMGDTMLAKCAEALALRKAFPNDLSGLYTSDEMEQAGGNNYPAMAEVEFKRDEPVAPTRPEPLGEERTAKFVLYATDHGVDPGEAIVEALGVDATVEALTVADVPALGKAVLKLAEQATSGSRLDPEGEGVVPAHAPEATPDPDDLTYSLTSARKRFFATVARRWPGLATDDREKERKAWLRAAYSVDSLTKLTVAQILEATDRLEGEADELDALEATLPLGDVLDAEVVGE